MIASEGIQIHANSFFKTSRPREVKKAATPIGETSIGRQGRKYRPVSNGAKNATPNPPFVIASRRPCDAVTMKKYPASIHHV